MARRASKSSSSPLVIILVAAVVVMAGVIAVLAGKGSGDRTSLTSLPIDDYMARASQLRGNSYMLEGKVEERFPRGTDELITVVVKTGPGQWDRLPVVVPPQAKSVNIEREQEYSFQVKVTTMNDQKGILVADSVSPIH